ncbi:activator of HSP90 ATPase [Pseudovibrio japonicus]|uniref:Activator of HSP90 ATPase n=1 Tax=Pseudovibrio japonicus TaxID=366534 RepID=A0ABQ3EAP6_9HYPH|nr:SRPBCC domain-containing protein [Pseudovibrio japonicus]GHB31492.1 activator of HSP90 ATPase [Pseudovibrio japonicus]
MSDTAFEIHLVREFDAPVELLFQMWADPQHMKHWGCPENFTITEIQMDFREGGTWATTMVGPDGTSYHMRGEYLQIDEPNLITNTNQWVNEDGTVTDPTTINMNFEALENNRSRLIVHEAKYTSMAFKKDNQDGWEGSLDNLAAYLRTCNALVR